MDTEMIAADTKLCCILTPEWKCSTCNWTICDSCIDSGIVSKYHSCSTVDDIHRLETYFCKGRVYHV